MSVQNDAPFAEQLRVQGQGSTTRFTVQYRDPANLNITAQVLAGSYRTPVLAAGAIYTIRAVVTAQGRRAGQRLVGPHRHRDLRHPPRHQGHGQVRHHPDLTGLGPDKMSCRAPGGDRIGRRLGPVGTVWLNTESGTSGHKR